MPKKVKRAKNQKSKTKRPYDSSRRQAQAAETRRQILEAARALFTERGYMGTTMDAVGEQAAVAVETVYAGFGSKRELLRGLLRNAIWGDPPVPFPERPEIQAAMSEPDQRRKVQLFVRAMTLVNQRAGAIWTLVRAAERSEPEIAAIVRDLALGRLEGMSKFVGSLSSNGPLRAGLTPAMATETAWTLLSPEVYSLVCADRGWSAQRYEEWLADSLERLLLD